MRIYNFFLYFNFINIELPVETKNLVLPLIFNNNQEHFQVEFSLIRQLYTKIFKEYWYEFAKL